MDLNVVASAYGKDSAPGRFIQNSGVLYLDPNKTRTEQWLHSIGLQLPSGLTTLGPIGRVTYLDGKVKLESVPAAEVVELSGESGGKLSLTGENLLEAEARAKALEKENAVLRE